VIARRTGSALGLSKCGDLRRPGLIRLGVIAYAIVGIDWAELAPVPPQGIVSRENIKVFEIGIDSLRRRY